MRFWYLSHRRATNTKASMCQCANSPEPSMLAYLKYGYSIMKIQTKIYISSPTLDICTYARIQRGGAGGPDTPTPEKSQKIGFLSNTDADPLKITKLPSQHSKSGHPRPTSETRFKWRFAGGSIMARF